MTIGILGGGRMGRRLAAGWAKAGHTVFIGSRDGEKGAQIAAEIGGGVRGGTLEEAKTNSEALVLATPGSVVENVVASLKPWENRILIDITNPLAGRIPEGLITRSTAEAVAEAAGDARVVKAFNMIFAHIFDNPEFPKGKAASFVCGDDDEARKLACDLSADLGFEPVDAGPLAHARMLEPLALLIIKMAGIHGNDIAYGWLSRDK